MDTDVQMTPIPEGVRTVEDRLAEAGFPPDQADTLIGRLGTGKVASLLKEHEGTEDRETPIFRSHTPRGQPKLSHWHTRFYQACLREMGEREGTQRIPTRIPNATQAWAEIINQRFKYEGDQEFTHSTVHRVVETFGGWKSMWTEFNKLDLSRARLRWVKAYNEMLG